MDKRDHNDGNDNWQYKSRSIGKTTEAQKIENKGLVDVCEEEQEEVRRSNGGTPFEKEGIESFGSICEGFQFLLQRKGGRKKDCISKRSPER